MAQPAVTDRSLTLAMLLERYVRTLEERASDDAISNRLSAAVVRRLTVRELRDLLGEHFDRGGQ